MAETATETKAPAVPKTPKTPAERKEARAGLLQLLLILLVGVGICYFSFELGVGVLAVILWLGSKFTGS